MSKDKIRLILVDDHLILREGLKFMLRNEPDVIVAGEAANGTKALELIRDSPPDVVLLDVKMPDLSGLETLRRIRERWPDLPVVILTMYDDPEFIDEALRSGAAGYLLKSVSREELVRAVRAARAGFGYLQAEITPAVLRRFAGQKSVRLAVHLTPREEEILGLLADGRSNRQIARDLRIAEATVKGYLRGLFEKLGAADRAQAVALALRGRLID